MTLKHPANVAEWTTTTGTGAYGLSGAQTGARTFGSALSDNDLVEYAARLNSDWESGLGTYDADTNMIARTFVVESSNSNNAVSWGPGTKSIVCAPLGARFFLPQGTAPTPTVDGETWWDIDDDRIVVGNGAGQAIFGQVSPWVAYTPTFTGFGTVANVSVWSRRVGDTLAMRARFTSGISTAVEGRMTLGYNGVNGGITSDATKVPGIQVAGPAGISAAVATNFLMLIESNVGYLTFGRQDGAVAALTKQNGSSIMSSGQTMSFMAEVPITGW